MDKKLEQWLNEQKAIKAKRRDEHLIELGLIDDAKTYEETTYYSGKGKAITAEEANKLKDNFNYVETITEKHYTPIQVTDEEYELICKYIPEGTNKQSPDEPSEKEYLRRIAKSTKTVSTILVVYVILSVIMGIILGISSFNLLNL